MSETKRIDGIEIQKCKECGDDLSISHNKIWCCTKNCKNHWSNILTKEEQAEDGFLENKKIPKHEFIGPEIKLINESTDLSKIDKINWDSYFNNIPLYVYRVEGYYHSIGGKWGNNDYWCCERSQEPNYKTLMEFAGNVCNWGISIEEKNYHKYKWEEHEILCTNKVIITRNGKNFYSFSVNDFDYGLAKAKVLLTEIHEHPISFNEIDYQNEIIGRKIQFNNMPCIIESYTIGIDRIIIKPDLECMPMDDWKNNLDEYFEGEESIPEDLFASSINWFRSQD